MPSPIGHALAGVGAAWAVDLLPWRRCCRSAPVSARWYDRAGGRLTVLCAALAALPDGDLIVRNAHRTITHSVGAVILVTIIAAAVTRWVTDKPVWRVALMCGTAYGTHLLLDWLGMDSTPPRGIQGLWPFSDRWYISGWDIFPEVSRRHILAAPSLWQNARAGIQEMAILVPILWAIWLVRIKAFSRLATELAGGDHPPQ